MQKTIGLLNLGRIARCDQCAAALAAFDSIGPGGRLVLTNVADPRALLREFQVSRAGVFDWYVLGASLTQMRVELRQRATTGPRSAAECLQADHRRLGILLSDTTAAIREAQRAKATKLFSHFACGLRLHIQAEETLLFPIVKDAVGLEMASSTVIGSEHAQLLRLVAMTGSALKRRDSAGAESSIHELSEMLVEHNMKEEHILYPVVDRSLGGPNECDAFVRQIQALGCG